MVTHEARIDRIEKNLNDPDEGLNIKVTKQAIGFINLSAKMNAILWMFGILIALGIANIVIGNI